MPMRMLCRYTRINTDSLGSKTKRSEFFQSLKSFNTLFLKNLKVYFYYIIIYNNLSPIVYTYFGLSEKSCFIDF